MSSDKNVKITAYLKVRCPKKAVPRTGPAKCCGSTPAGAFCSTCGTATKYTTVQVQVDAVHQYDIAASIDENLCYLHSNCDMPDGDRDGRQPGRVPGRWAAGWWWGATWSGCAGIRRSGRRR